jgi:hypothetical protein
LRLARLEAVKTVLIDRYGAPDELGQRGGARHAEAAAEGGELGRAQVLIPEDQHRMLGKGSLDCRVA